MNNISVRSATAADAAGVAHVYLASRRAFLAFAPLVHSDDEVRKWTADVLIPGGSVFVAAETGEREGVVGMMALARRAGRGWIDHLYLLPSAVGQGVGARLLERAKETLGSPIRLYTFQANLGARRFYERQGFRLLQLGDGSRNEEHCPDALYEWKETP